MEVVLHAMIPADDVAVSSSGLKVVLEAAGVIIDELSSFANELAAADVPVGSLALATVSGNDSPGIEVLLAASGPGSPGWEGSNPAAGPCRGRRGSPSARRPGRRGAGTSGSG